MSNKDKKKIELTPAEKAWKENLNREWDKFKEEHLARTGEKITLDKLSTEQGYSPSYLGTYNSGQRRLNVKMKILFAEVLGIPISKIDPELNDKLIPIVYRKKENPALRVAEDSAEYTADIEPWDESIELEADKVLIPYYTQTELSAGSGRLADYAQAVKKLPFSRSTLRKMGVPPSAACALKVSGNSQFPMIRDGNTVGVDKSKTEIKDGEMYAINHDGMARLKVLYQLPGGKIRLYSYNTQEYPEEIIQGEELKTITIIGRVFWYSGLL